MFSIIFFAIIYRIFQISFPQLILKIVMDGWMDEKKGWMDLRKDLNEYLFIL